MDLISHPQVGFGLSSQKSVALVGLLEVSNEERGVIARSSLKQIGRPTIIVAGFPCVRKAAQGAKRSLSRNASEAHVEGGRSSARLPGVGFCGIMWALSSRDRHEEVSFENPANIQRSATNSPIIGSSE
jgi:hypothetical protein